MDREEAKEYWAATYEVASEWDDFHWEASERKEHKRYVDAVKAAIEALSERTGEWIMQNEELKISDYRCSECGHYQDDKTDFCPNCGAKMVANIT